MKITPSMAPLQSLLKIWLLLGLCTTAHAEKSPVGVWRSIDDNTLKPRAEIRIDEANGILTGHIVKSLNGAKPGKVCDKCSDDRKGKPLIGMEIIRQAKKLDETGVWGGEILDPDNGKIYRLKLTPLEGGGKLQVRGYIGPFFRTQIWLRVVNSP